MACSDEQFCRLHHIGDLFRIEFLYRYLVGDDDVGKLRDTVEHIMEIESQAKVIVDMSNIERISSSVLGEVINAKKKLSDSKGQMCLAGVLPQIEQMIGMLQIDQVVDLEPTVSAAVDGFSP